MENQQQVQPEVLSSIALLNVGGQPYIEYNVNGMRDAFALSWEQISQLQNKWREELFFLRGEREKAILERQKEEAEKVAETDGVTEEVSEVVQTEESPSTSSEEGKEEESE